MIHHSSALVWHNLFLSWCHFLLRDLPPSALLSQGTRSLLMITFVAWNMDGWLGSPQALGVHRPSSHFFKSDIWPSSTSYLDNSHLLSGSHSSIIWAASVIQSQAVQLASQNNSVFLSFETEASRSEDCQRASYWVRHAFLINYIWLPWWASY